MGQVARCAHQEDGSARAGKQYKAQKGEVIFEDQELRGGHCWCGHFLSPHPARQLRMTWLHICLFFFFAPSLPALLALHTSKFMNAYVA